MSEGLSLDEVVSSIRSSHPRPGGLGPVGNVQSVNWGKAENETSPLDDDAKAINSNVDLALASSARVPRNQALDTGKEFLDIKMAPPAPETEEELNRTTTMSVPDPLPNPPPELADDNRHRSVTVSLTKREMNKLAEYNRRFAASKEDLEVNATANGIRHILALPDREVYDRPAPPAFPVAEMRFSAPNGLYPSSSPVDIYGRSVSPPPPMPPCEPDIPILFVGMFGSLPTSWIGLAEQEGMLVLASRREPWTPMNDGNLLLAKGPNKLWACRFLLRVTVPGGQTHLCLFLVDKEKTEEASRP